MITAALVNDRIVNDHPKPVNDRIVNDRPKPVIALALGRAEHENHLFDS
jgi:hypothetical protein